MRACILFISFLFFSIFILPAQVSVTSKTDKTSYIIGDYIRLEVNATIDSTMQIVWPSPADIAPYDLITGNPVDTVAFQGKIQLKQELIYSIYEAGNYTIPSVVISYKKPRDTTYYSAASDSINITILTVEVDTTQTIKPIKDIINVTVKNMLWVYIVAGILILGAIGFAVYYSFFRKEPKQVVVPRQEIIPLHIIALRKLDALEEKKLWQKNELKLYYSELTGIMREYMEKRFGINAMESTSDEIVDQLILHKAALGQTDKVDHILRLADMAKFAKSHPSSDQNMEAMQLTREFIEATRQLEQKK